MEKEIISTDTLKELDASIKHLFDATSKVLEEAGVPHTTNDISNDLPALGVSTSVQAPAFNPAPWVAIGLFFFIGVSLLITAIVKNFQPQLSKADRISAAVDEIVARRSPETIQQAQTTHKLINRIKKRFH